LDLRQTKVKSGKSPFSNNDVVTFKTKIPSIDRKNELVPGFTLYVPSNDEQENYIGILNESAQKCKQIIEFIEKDSMIDNHFVVDVYINNYIYIASGKATTKKEAKRDSAFQAYTILKDKQSIVYKDEINHDDVETIKKGELVKAAYVNADKIADNNMGNKLLRKMGWTGSGGVGKFEHGISDPIFVDAVEDRRGVGHEFENRSIKKASVQSAILQFIGDDERSEIKFSSDLSKEDRALVHNLCQRYHLKHKSFGKGEQRYLVVSKKENS